jgi:hypothetical protein
MGILLRPSLSRPFWDPARWIWRFPYILATIAVIAAIYECTDLLLAFLVHVPDSDRIFLDISLAVFTGVQFLRQQESMLNMLGPEEDDPPHLLPGDMHESDDAS